MAAPVATYLRLADDSAYTGKKLHAQSRVVGSDTVYERIVTFDRAAKVIGVYEGSLAQATVSATAQDGIATGFLWAHMPTSVTGRSARIRRAYFTSQFQSTLTVSPSAPRLRFDRFTFTGTATGTTSVPDRDLMYNAPKFDLRTTVTGLTVTLVAGLGTGAVVGALTSVSAFAPASIAMQELAATTNEEDEWIVIAPGEGVVFYQDTAGVTSDTRRLDITVVFDEIDTA